MQGLAPRGVSLSRDADKISLATLLLKIGAIATCCAALGSAKMPSLFKLTREHLGMLTL